MLLRVWMTLRNSRLSRRRILKEYCFGGVWNSSCLRWRRYQFQRRSVRVFETMVRDQAVSGVCFYVEPE
jgi:hypothetical protein